MDKVVNELYDIIQKYLTAGGNISVILCGLIDRDLNNISIVDHPDVVEQAKRTKDSIRSYEWYKSKPAKQATPFRIANYSNAAKNGYKKRRVNHEDDSY